MKATVYEGSVITCDEQNNVFKYLVTEGKQIAYVGNELPVIYKNSDVIQLGKKALLPSFVDTHMHFASFAIFNAGLNVMEAESNAEILQMVDKFARTSKDKLLIAFGASPYSVKERVLVTRTELDTVCPDKPLMIVKYDGHACIVNTKLLKLIESKVSSLRGYNADNGEMRQEAFFAVSNYITNSISPIQLVKNMQKASNFIASKGIGMVHTVSGVGFPMDLDMDIEKWVGKGFNNGFQVREFVQTMDVKKAQKRKLPRIGGCFATALDGCFGSMDAALNAPYQGTDSKGILYYSDEKVIEFCKAANRANLQIEVHAIGDAAFDQATRAIKAALDDYPRADHRHGIIHCCLPTAEGIKICKDYNIQIPLQSSFINWRQEPDEYLENILGDRLKKLNPLKTYADNGIFISAGSDAPCTSPDPILWIHNACNNGKESLDVYTALRMCTYNGCRVSFDEKERGTLEKDKLADMVILSDNPYSVKKENLKNIQPLELILCGKPYQAPSKGVIAHILSGMLNKHKI